MARPIPHLPARCVAEGFVAAPVTASAALGLAVGVVDGGFGAGLGIAAIGLFLFGLPATLLLGLPLYLALRRRVQPTLVNCAVAGALVGGAPMAALHLWLHPYLSAQGMARDVSEFLALPAAATVAGALGGVVFWAVAVWPPAKRTPRADASS